MRVGNSVPYVLALKTAYQYQLQNRGEIFGKVTLYFIVVSLFSQVYSHVHEEGARLWYLGLTQALNMSILPLSFRIVAEFTSGSYEHFTLRPVQFFTYKFCEGLGATLANLTLLYPILCGQCYFLTGYMPPLANVLIALLVGLVSLILYQLITITISFSAQFTKEVKQIYFLNMTSGFCLGGLIMPLETYSPFVQKISYLTPYPFILSLPAKLLSGPKMSISHLTQTLPLIHWILFFCLVNHLLARGLRHRIAEGGL